MLLTNTDERDKMNFAIWLYKTYKHETGAHFAQSLFTEGVALFPSHHKAVMFARQSCVPFDWKYDVVAVVGEHSLEFWEDSFRGHHNISNFKRMAMRPETSH